MTPEEYREYMDELAERARKHLHDGPHPFEPDPKCDLYCARCGAERLGFYHRGQ